MAPEQLAGKPASIRSDIYALGLILFEIFTGRRAYDAKSLGDLKQLHDTGTVTTPSSIVRDLDPAIERVILRCLARDPEQRPASALDGRGGAARRRSAGGGAGGRRDAVPGHAGGRRRERGVGVGRGLAAVAFVVIGL